MLEYIYEDIVRKYHFIFHNEICLEEGEPNYDLKIQKAKLSVKLDRIEFYLSTFFHHL